ncbi:5896_t:CDS:1, partial [Funneliformis mosseae]
MSKRYISYDYQEAEPSNNSGNDDNKIDNLKLSDNVKINNNEI